MIDQLVKFSHNAPIVKPGGALTLESFNCLDALHARDLMARCCASSRWVDAMVAGRPYASMEKLFSSARASWSGMAEQDWLEAFEGHPMIGDPESLGARYRDTLAIASREQSGAGDADEATLDELARMNREYLDRFGFIFIIFASGRSAGEMLAELRTRLGHSRARELEIAVEEQWKITLQRLARSLAEPVPVERGPVLIADGPVP
jgi:2-oxo-4-hydroxy-4-carboxy-5-ureidoimidazoline decarboxylase